MNQNVLETLDVLLVGNDKEMQAFLQEAVKQAKTSAKEIQDAFATAFKMPDGTKAFTDEVTKAAKVATDGMEGVGKAATDAFDTAGQAAKEAGEAFKGMGPEQIVKDIEALNVAMRKNHEDIRAGSITQEEYRRVLGSQRDEMKTLFQMYNQASRGVKGFGDAVKPTVEANEELDATLKRLSNETRTQRNLWAGRIQGDAAFRESTEKLHQEMEELRKTGELTGDQMRKLTADMAYAQRGIDSVDKVASRGGLAWTARIGIMDAHNEILRSTGPAGQAAATGLGIMQNAFKNLQAPIDVSALSLRNVLGGITGVLKAVPLLTAAAGVAATAALWRMSTASAELANQIDVATFRTGMSAEAFQEMSFAASQAGVDTSILETTLQRLQRRAADANAGNAGLQDSFRRLGVTLTDANGEMLGTEELLNQVADGLAGVENNADRLALAFKVFDTEGARLLPLLSRGSAGIAELREEARELGLVISGDTVMSLVEFGNSVDRMQKQFETAKTEIVAAFLPVLRDVLIPLINQAFIPAIQTAADRLGDFADKFTETGPVGEAFRRDTLSNISLLLELGNTAFGVVQGIMTALNAVAAVPVYLGGATRGAIDALGGGVMEQVNADRARLEEHIASMTAAYVNMTDLSEEGRAAFAAQIREQEQRLAAMPANVGEYIAQAAGNASNQLFDNVISGWDGMMTTFQRDVESEFSGFIESAFSGLGETGARPARAAGEVTGAEFGTGFNAGAAGTMDPLAGIRLWTDRLSFELEQGLMSPVGVIRELGGHVDWLVSERDRLFAAGEFGTEAWTQLNNELSLAAATLKTATDLLPELVSVPMDDGQGLSEVAADAYAAARAADDLADAQAALAASYVTGTVSLEQFRIQLVAQERADAQRQVVLARQAAEADASAQAVADLADAQAALEASYSRSIPTLEEFNRQFASSELATAHGQMILARQEVEAVGMAAATAAERVNTANAAIADGARLEAIRRSYERMGDAAADLDALTASLNQLTDTSTPLERLRADLEAFAAQGEAFARDVQPLIDSLDAFEKQALVAAAAAEKFRTETTDLGTKIQGDGLAGALQDVDGWLQVIGSNADGALGALANGLSDAVGIAQKFVGGDIIGGSQALLGAIISGIQGVINANAEWDASLDRIASRYRTLSRDTIEALTTTVSETRWFLFIPYQVRVVDDNATNAALEVASTFMGALEGALTSTDFGADFSLGIDRIIQQELINGFMLKGPVQAAIVAFNEAIAAGELVGAESIYRNLLGLTEEQNRLLREQFPDLYKLTSTAQDYADAMQAASRAAEDLRAATAASGLERAFATGAVGIEQYRDLLLSIGQSDVMRDFTRQLADLAQVRQDAIADGANPDYIRALDDQAAALKDAYRNALEQGAFEAAETVRGILGTSIDSLRGVMTSALDSVDLDGFWQSWGDGMHGVTRSALMRAWLDGQVFATLSDTITDAVLDGVLTGDELQSIKDAYEAAGNEGALLWEILEGLGLGFQDLNETVNSVNASMRNIPSVWRSTQAQFDSVNVSGGSFAGSGMRAASTQAAGPTINVTVAVNGPTYGVDDLDARITNTVQGAVAEGELAQYGRTR